MTLPLKMVPFKITRLIRILEFLINTFPDILEDPGPLISTGVEKNEPKLKVSVFSLRFLMIQLVENAELEHKNSATSFPQASSVSFT